MSESILHERQSTLFDMGFVIYAVGTGQPVLIKVLRHNYAVPFRKVKQEAFYSDYKAALADSSRWLLECITEALVEPEPIDWQETSLPLMWMTSTVMSMARTTATEPQPMPSQNS